MSVISKQGPVRLIAAGLSKDQSSSTGTGKSVRSILGCRYRSRQLGEQIIVFPTSRSIGHVFHERWYGLVEAFVVASTDTFQGRLQTRLELQLLGRLKSMSHVSGISLELAAGCNIGGGITPSAYSTLLNFSLVPLSPDA
jgi:hypothetical protein